ncbi:MAG: hypothetical protein D6802_11055 [Ardenticatenia bacterium]|nr:MAG: hypothetical protein D6802_11055 [Ardenticatenia bacterium]
MRPIETVIVLLVIVVLALPKRFHTWWRWLWGATLLALALHLWQEGWRWQLVPLYLVILAIPFAIRFSGKARAAATAFLLLFVTSSLLAAWAFPIPTMPTPSGPYAVGTTTLHLVDPSREERYTPDIPDDPRELMVQIWYPAEATAQPPAPWNPDMDILAPELGKWTGLPGWMYSHLRLVQSHAVADAPFAKEASPAPILFYVHGWGGFRTIHANLMETLASHGYIVIAADHTYGAMVTRFPDGRVALNYPDALPEGAPRDQYLAAARILVGVFADDVRFMLNQLDTFNQTHPILKDHLDTNRIGLIGHSTGGGAVVEVCLSDERCDALVGYDAWVEPLPRDMLAEGLHVPSMFMRSEPWVAGKNAPNLALLYNASQPPTYMLTIKGAHHRDFTMLPLLSPIADDLGLRGPIPAEEMLELTDAYTLAMFDTYLRNTPSPLLSGEAHPYPDVLFEQR